MHNHTLPAWFQSVRHGHSPSREYFAVLQIRHDIACDGFVRTDAQPTLNFPARLYGALDILRAMKPRPSCYQAFSIWGVLLALLIACGAGAHAAGDPARLEEATQLFQVGQNILGED